MMLVFHKNERKLSKSDQYLSALPFGYEFNVLISVEIDNERNYKVPIVK